MERVVIIAAKRTPNGKFNGQFAKLTAKDLGEAVLKATIASASLDPEKIDGLILGNVLSAGTGQNLARQIAIASGLDTSSTATVINEVCGSSLKALRVAQTMIMVGDADILAVGGTESMSNAPILVDRHETSNRLDSLQYDGLRDAFSDAPMGLTAENVAHKYHVDRQTQDLFAFESHQKAYAAFENGWFDEEVVPITTPNGQTYTRDETIRPDTSPEILAKLRPVFKEDGTVTAGNAAPLNDGAAMLIIASEKKAQQLHLKPIAYLDTYAETGFDPELMGYAPYYAIKKMLTRSQKTIADYDLFEINEAFAAQSYAVMRDLQIPDKKLNIAGGALSLGHPLGATGTRLVVTMLNNLRQTDQKSGLVSLCIGGGMGISYGIELIAS